MCDTCKKRDYGEGKGKYLVLIEPNVWICGEPRTLADAVRISKVCGGLCTCFFIITRGS